MNGHVFQCHEEIPKVNQFTRTREELVSNCSAKYSYRNDMGSVPQHLREQDIKQYMPQDLRKDATDSKEIVYC